MSKAMPMSMLLGGKKPSLQQALLGCHLTDKSTDCKLIWLLVNIKVTSQVTSEQE